MKDGFKHFRKTLTNLVRAWQTAMEARLAYSQDKTNFDKRAAAALANRRLLKWRRFIETENFLMRYYVPINDYLHDSILTDEDRRFVTMSTPEIVRHLLVIIAKTHKLVLHERKYDRGYYFDERMKIR